VASRYTERTKINLSLLKFFLLEMGKRGIFITIDQPHQYMAYMLKMQNVPQDGLIFIDAISRISGERECNVSNVRFVNGPFEMDFLSEISSVSHATGAGCDRTVRMDSIDFILVDDIAALTKYQDDEGVRRMIASYLDSIEPLRGLTAPIVLDINSDSLLYELVSERCDSILLLNLARSVFKELPLPNVRGNAARPHLSLPAAIAGANGVM
jgi:hypothetical protein